MRARKKEIRDKKKADQNKKREASGLGAKKTGGDDGQDEEDGGMGLDDVLEAQKQSGFVPVDMDEETQMKMILEMEYAKNRNAPKVPQSSGMGGAGEEEDDPELAAAIAASLAMMNIDGQEENKNEEVKQE